jgi:Uma2 family endonuclease
MAVQEKLYTAEDLLAMSGDIKHIELVKGELVEMAPSVDKHGIMSNEIGYAATDHVKKHNLRGYVTIESAGYILFRNPDTVRAPDVAYISKDRLPDKPQGKYFPVAPDLAVEIVFDHDSASEVQEKVLEYLRAGTLLVWVFYPKTKTVAVHTSEGSRTLETDAVLDGDPVLPGFKLSVRDVFAVLDE